MQIFAASLNYTEAPSSSQNLESELLFKIAFSISSADDTAYYLRGVFYKSGTSNYCGITWNGANWYSGPYSSNDGWKNFQKIIIKDGKWEGDVKVKIDNTDTGCKESGEYKFKLQRFTESGSSNFDTQDEKTFTFVIPTATPTITPTLAATPTSPPTATPKTTKTPTPGPTEKKTTMAVSPTASPSNKNDSNTQATSSALKEEVLGSEDAAISNTPKPLEENNKTIASNSKLLPKIMISAGAAILIITCGILAYLKYKREKEEI